MVYLLLPLQITTGGLATYIVCLDNQLTFVGGCMFALLPLQVSVCNSALLAKRFSTVAQGSALCVISAFQVSGLQPRKHYFNNVICSILLPCKATAILAPRLQCVPATSFDQLQSTPVC